MDTLQTVDDEKLRRYQKKIRIYLLKCFLSEASKILIMAVIFNYFQLLNEFWAALIFLMLLRTNGGGIHCKHYISCFCLSFIVMGSSILTAKYIPIPTIAALLILIVCAFAGYMSAPIVSDNRPAPSDKLIIRSKRITFVLILMIAILRCICPSNPYVDIGVWTAIIHISQLLLAKFLQRRKENYVMQN